jgi:hypothetical protein
MLAGQNKKSSARWSQTGLDQTTVYGSSTNLWGLTWSAADINGGNFGLAISARGSAFEGTEDALVDHITITVHFTPSGTVCTRLDPTVMMQAPLAQNITAGSGTADYTVSITNNDNGGACGSSIFTLTANDTETIGSGSFVLPSTFDSGNSVTLAEGASMTKTLRVTAVVVPNAGDQIQTTVTAANIDHTDVTSAEIAVTTINLAPVCTQNAPLVEILDPPKTITLDNGSVNYNVRITNQDSGGACTNPLTINLSRSDSNGNFTSSIPASVSLAPGANTTVVLQVTEQTAASGETTDTTVTATAAGHPNGTDNVVTTYSPTPVCTANTPVLSINPCDQ